MKPFYHLLFINRESVFKLLLLLLLDLSTQEKDSTYNSYNFQSSYIHSSSFIQLSKFLQVYLTNLRIFYDRQFLRKSLYQLQ